MNPDSRYMETTRIEGLTLYDIERKPRQVVRRAAPRASTRRARVWPHLTAFPQVSRDEAGPIVCKIATSALNIELTCPICLGICKQTTIVKEVRRRGGSDLLHTLPSRSRSPATGLAPHSVSIASAGTV